jgi:hypothetical protein
MRKEHLLMLIVWASLALATTLILFVLFMP